MIYVIAIITFLIGLLAGLYMRKSTPTGTLVYNKNPSKEIFELHIEDDIDVSNPPKTVSFLFKVNE